MGNGKTGPRRAVTHSFHFRLFSSSCASSLFEFRAGFSCSKMIDLFIRSTRGRNRKYRELSHTRGREEENRISLETAKNYWKNPFQMLCRCWGEIRTLCEAKYFHFLCSSNGNSVVTSIVHFRMKYLSYTRALCRIPCTSTSCQRCSESREAIR